MKRKTPIKHKVRKHTRKGKSVRSHTRGKGKRRLKTNITRHVTRASQKIDGYLIKHFPRKVYRTNGYEIHIESESQNIDRIMSMIYSELQRLPRGHNHEIYLKEHDGKDYFSGSHKQANIEIFIDKKHSPIVWFGGIKYIFLHEIGHMLGAKSEKDADMFAQKYVSSVEMKLLSKKGLLSQYKGKYDLKKSEKLEIDRLWQDFKKSKYKTAFLEKQTRRVRANLDDKKISDRRYQIMFKEFDKMRDLVKESPEKFSANPLSNQEINKLLMLTLKHQEPKKRNTIIQFQSKMHYDEKDFHVLGKLKNINPDLHKKVITERIKFISFVTEASDKKIDQSRQKLRSLYQDVKKELERAM